MRVDGTRINVKLDTAYPLDGSMQVAIDTSGTEALTACFRIPDWVSEGTISCGNRRHTVRGGDGYVELPVTGNAGIDEKGEA
jgi:DUF1680 family protein